MKIECPICHNVLEGKPEWHGKKAQCPYCRNKFFISDAAPEAATLPAADPGARRNDKARQRGVIHGKK